MQTEPFNASLLKLTFGLVGAVIIGLVIWKAPFVLTRGLDYYANGVWYLRRLTVSVDPYGYILTFISFICTNIILLLLLQSLIVNKWYRAILRPMPILLAVASYYAFSSLMDPTIWDRSMGNMGFMRYVVDVFAGCPWPIFNFMCQPLITFGLISRAQPTYWYTYIAPFVAYLSALKAAQFLSALMDKRYLMPQIISGGDNRTFSALKRLHAKARSVDRAVASRVYFYLYDGDGNDNALALDEHHIAIGSWVAEGLSRNENDPYYQQCAAIVFHEFGHLANKDVLANNFCITTLYIYSSLILVLFYVAQLFLIVVSIVPYVGSLARAVIQLLNYLQWLLRSLLVGFVRLGNIIGGKRHEAQADAFAVKCGAGNALAQFFEGVKEEYGEGALMDEHPRMTARISAIRASQHAYEVRQQNKRAKEIASPKK